MPHTQLCIVARPMSRPRASLLLAFVSTASVLAGVGGCKQLDGRSKVRDGNKDYHEAQAAADRLDHYAHQLYRLHDAEYADGWRITALATETEAAPRTPRTPRTRRRGVRARGLHRDSASAAGARASSIVRSPG